MNEFAADARISRLADIEESTRGSRVVVGPGSMIDAFVKIKMAGGTGDVIIGKDCYINSGTVIYSGHGVTLGEAVLIAANCTLAPVNHEYRDPGRTMLSQRFAPGRGGIVVEDDVWIGANTVLLDGTLIRRGCVIGAGSVVRGELEAYGVYAGSPLRLVKRRGE